MKISMQHHLVSGGDPPIHPSAETGIVQKVASVVMIWRHQQRNPPHTPVHQVASHHLGGFTSAGADIVNRHNKPRSGRFFFLLGCLH